MRILCLLAWLMVPLLVGAYHYGPGQEQMEIDAAAAQVKAAERLAAQKEISREDWAQIVEQYDAAIELLPEEKLQQIQRLTLERSKAKMECSRLPEAREELSELVASLEAKSDKDKTDERLLEEARASLGISQYYMTWLMRLEGKPREIWEPEIEASRQTFKYLAEESQAQGQSEEVASYQEDLESVIRLARMDLRDLQGLPLPSQ